MRQVTLISLLLLISFPAFPHRDFHEQPQTLTLSFSSGVIATFSLTDDREPRIAGIRIHVGAHDYLVPATECAKLQDIHFQTVKFVFNNSYPSAEDANYFYLEFDMGAPRTKAFGEYPKVEVMFRDRVFQEAHLTRKISADEWQGSTL